MGAGQSVPNGSAPARGLHVLRVTPSSPASQTDIEPFFDFIIGYADASISLQNTNIEAHDFEKVVEQHEGKGLNLLVWNSKSQTVRQVPITPSRGWSEPQLAEGSAMAREASQPSLLGLSMRVCEPELSLDNVWHVLDVLEGSPAESAGLVPYGDWIVGWSGGVLAAEGDFYDVVEAHEDKPLRVYVYSYDFDTLREVVLVPNRQWGGEGLLGCVFGFGLLHRIPKVLEDTPEETEEYYDDNGVFVPADEMYNIHHDHEDVLFNHDTQQPSLSVTVTNSKEKLAALAESSNDPGVGSHYLDPPFQRPRTTSPVS